MDLRKLKTILDLFESSAIQELEITEGKDKLRLVKNLLQENLVPQVVQSKVRVGEQHAGKEIATLKLDEKSSGIDKKHDLIFKVEAPLVGIYFASPSADDPPFVKVGEHVKEGDVICIIEAMKMFNSVNAPVSGKVIEIVAKNEHAVGFGDLLMTIKKDN